MSRIDVLNKRVARVLNLRGCGDTSPEEYDDADAALSSLVAIAKDARMKERAKHLADNRSSLDRAYGFKEEVERLRRHVSEAEHLAADQSQSADEWQERAERAERERDEARAEERRWYECFHAEMVRADGLGRVMVNFHDIEKRAEAAEARVAALEGAGSDRRIVRIKAAEARVVELEANALVAVSWLDQAIGFISWDQTGSGIALAEKLDFARAALATPDPQEGAA